MNAVETGGAQAQPASTPCQFCFGWWGALAGNFLCSQADVRHLLPGVLPSVFLIWWLSGENVTICNLLRGLVCREGLEERLVLLNILPLCSLSPKTHWQPLICWCCIIWLMQDIFRGAVSRLCDEVMFLKVCGRWSYLNRNSVNLPGLHWAYWLVHLKLALLSIMYLMFQKVKIKKICASLSSFQCLNCSLSNLHHILSIFLLSGAMRMATPRRESLLTWKALLKVDL